jgi:nucleoid-associated protein YgaU
MTAPAEGQMGGNFFTNKWGPLPVWAWLAVGASTLLVVSYLRNKQNAANSTNSAAANTDLSSQVPQFVNQTFTSVTPPEPEPPTPTPVPIITPHHNPTGRPGDPLPVGTSVQHPHRIVKGDTLAKLAKEFYGSATPTNMDRILQHNFKVIKNRNKLPVGKVIEIPGIR